MISKIKKFIIKQFKLLNYFLFSNLKAKDKSVIATPEQKILWVEKAISEYNNIKNLVLKIREDPKGYKPKVGDWILGHSGSGPNTAIVFQWTEAQENVENINCIKFEPFNGVLPSWVKE